MSEPIISVEGLGKKYLLGAKREPYVALRDVLARQLSGLFRRRAAAGPPPEEFWALRDVTFDVQPGEVVGIIGRNGAGKSTLLKILSRITEPTRGRVTIAGRVASLLEVGTGFHPELTGRENIYLNGAILGMTRLEIKKKFDEIVAFAEVERFLDTPVKRYSSGMYVRLAFAVAAHLEPEILVIDEVLAVGDVEFQKKCLGKMNDVAGDGRTVLFVSHNMNSIEMLCQRVIHLRKGCVLEQSTDVRAIVASYLRNDSTAQESEWTNPGGALKNPWFHPRRLYLGDSQGEPFRRSLRNDEPMFVYIEGETEEEDPALSVGYSLSDEAGMVVYWTTYTDVAENEWLRLSRGRNILRAQIPPRYLNEGNYCVELLGGICNRQWISQPGVNSPAIFFSIQGGLSDSPYWIEKRPGVMAPVHNWTLIKTFKQ